MISSKKHLALIATALAVVLVICITSYAPANCAPTSNNANNNNNRNSRPGILSNLFRRQTGSSSSSSNDNSNSESDIDDPQAQTEKEAQQFMDSLPGANNNNNGPSTFRERVSDTFGVLRDGVSNHFRSLRENFSDTYEDLRDTWTSSSE